MIDWQSAQKLVLECCKEKKIQTISLTNALGKILAEDILADRDYPPFNRSAMDGYAVNSQYFNALDQKRIPNQGKVLAGETYNKKIDFSRCLKIMTGAPVPEGLDAVIRVEDSLSDCDMVTFLDTAPLKEFKNIARKGQDVKENELVLKKNTILNPQNLQVLATIGKDRITVFQSPKIGLITTGDEVIELGKMPEYFEIRNSNKYAIQFLLESKGFALEFHLHISDNQVEIKNKIEECLPKIDILILTGGVSMGDADFVPQCLMECGIEKIFHKVETKPGKPIWFGKNEEKTVFGLPGNPLSAFLDTALYILPYLTQNTIKLSQLTLATAQKSAGIDRFIPFFFDENGLADTKNFNGSGDITSLLGVDGFMFVPKDKSYQINDYVKAFLL